MLDSVPASPVSPATERRDGLGLREVSRLLGAQALSAADALDRVRVHAGFAADLMSDVLAFGRPGALLVTGLATIQVVQTAEVAGLAGVLFVAGKKPAAAAVELAASRGLPLLTTERGTFEVCGRLWAAGLPPVVQDRPERVEPAGAEEVLFSERYRIRGNDYEHGGEVATRIKATLRELGLDPEVIRRLSIANFEAEMNVVMYADEAELELQVMPDRVRVVLRDRGPGIPDLDLAMQEGWSTATPAMRQRGFGAGLGLPNIRRNSDSFEITSTPGQGTTLHYAVRLKR